MAHPIPHSGVHSKQILICDDDPLFRKTLGVLLQGYGTVVAVQHSDEALALLQRRSFDLLILDVQMRTPDEGLRAIPRVHAIVPDLTILMLSGRNDFGTVREALRVGAADYLVKDFEPEEFKIAIERVLGKGDLEKRNRNRGAETIRESKHYRLVGETPAIAQVRKIADKFRASDANVLIRGETGTGKEIVARLLRKSESDGSFEPFVAIDSATLHSQTAESILFGHEKGAFTGADRIKRGLFEEADGGIIFFDEIGNMPVEIQAKLLRVLQEKEIVRLGSNRPIPLAFRVVAATNRPLEEMANTGAFLPDLLQRLNVLPITLPNLRERRDDISLLVDHFLRGKGGDSFEMTAAAREAFANYRWPGNVRELFAMIEYSAALSDDRVIDLADLHPRILDPANSLGASAMGFYAKVADYEAELLRSAYGNSSGNISQLALELGMDRSHLHTKLKLYGIHPPRSR